MTLRHVLVPVLLAPLLSPAAALAGTATVSIDAGTVRVVDDADDGVLAVTRAGDAIVVSPGDGTDTVVTGGGCSRDASTREVTCAAALRAVIEGNGGDDRLTGSSGPDLLDGGPGDDELSGGAGADDLRGGEGIDRVRYSGATPVRVSLDDVTDDGASGEGDNVHADVEDVATGSGADTVVGSAVANEIATGGGADTIDPGAGADRVLAGSGDDTVAARDGAADAVSCGAGDDTLTSDTADTSAACEAIDAAGPAPAADTRRPTLELSLASEIPARSMRKGVPLTLSSDELVTAEIEVIGRSSKARIARAGDFVAAARVTRDLLGTREIVVTFARRRLRSIRRKATLTVRVIASDAAGNLAIVTRSFRVS